MATENEIQSAAIKAASKAGKSKDSVIPKRITLSNGIVLKVKPMPPMLLNSVANSIPEPEVPKVFLEDKGREEPNPNHPDYLRAVAERNSTISLATINLILFACTEIIEVPDDVWKLESDDWVPLAKMAKVNFDPKDKTERYLAWLRCYALQTIDDLNQAQMIPLKLSGITEEEVEEAMETFRGGEVGDTDQPISIEIGSSNGDHVSDSDTGDSSGD
jgi:hypothetical protein